MSAPYVKIPLVIFESRNTGILTSAQFDVLEYCYWRAERPDYIVRGYSAENVCRFQGLDATKANLKRYQRAAADLLNLTLLRRDYYHVDARQLTHHPRPYNVWIPDPSRFSVIGTSEENRVSLFVSVNVAKDVADNVAKSNAITNGQDTTYENNESDIVAKTVAKGHRILSVTNHTDPKTIKKYPLNLPSGDFSPAPLPFKGEDAAAGLQNKPADTKPAGMKSLNAQQCDLLNKAALLYADFSVWLWDFSPDVNHVKRLLREFTPTEILFAQITRFEPYEKFSKTTMAHFFRSAAKDAIDVGRINGTSKSKPRWFNKPDSDFNRKEYSTEFFSRWMVVTDAWKIIFVGVASGEVLEKK
jgi:hypothetical protein